MDPVDVGAQGLEQLIEHEWLTANGLGGYASSSICGMNTRKYHGLLVAAMTPPVRRMVILSRVDETVITAEGAVELSTNEYPGTLYPRGFTYLRAFSADPFPRWAYQADGFTLEKSVRLLRGENTVCIAYTLLAGTDSVELELRPLLALRGIHDLMYQWNGRLRAEPVGRNGHRIAATARTPEVFLAHDGEFTGAPTWYLNTIYRREQDRGYAGLEDLWMPGVIRRTLSPGQTLHLVCSMEPIELDRVKDLAQRAPESAQVSVARKDAGLAELSRAAAVYVVEGSPRPGAPRATGIMTHYPWSSPSVRGAMISLAGLLLVPGRFEEARSLLESTAALADEGVLPSALPEDGGKPILQGADVSLWFVNAVHQYFDYTGDDATIRRLWPVMQAILDRYRQGTHLGISADSQGLIQSSVIGLPTSWMDAKFENWVVTQRQGRPVELNALWYNALRIAADFAGRFGEPARAAEFHALANAVQDAFNARFWNPSLNCLFDVVDDRHSDPAVRPNQIFAVSLPYPVLTSDRYAAVIDIVVSELLTPMGLRTLSPRNPAYQGAYGGNIIARDRAYHQGSAYPWLLGPLVTAIVKTRGRTETTLAYARQIVAPAMQYITGPGMGMIRELFNGDAPQRPGGALGSSPAAAELLRCWAEDILGIRPSSISDSPLSSGAFPKGQSAIGNRQ